MRTFKIFGSAGSLLLSMLFSGCGAQAAHCSGFSCCRAQALGHTGFSRCGSWAVEHRLNSCGARASLLHNKKGHCNKQTPALQLEKSPHSNEDPEQPKKKERKKILKKNSNNNKKNLCSLFSDGS